MTISVLLWRTVEEKERHITICLSTQCLVSKRIWNNQKTLNKVSNAMQEFKMNIFSLKFLCFLSLQVVSP